MKKQSVIFLAIIGTALLIAGGLFVFLKQQKSSTPSVSTPSPTPSPEPQETWNDPAGFTFTYPKGIVIDKHDEDTEHYAHIEMTHPDHPGTIFIWAKDTNAASLDAWIKGDKTLKGATTVDTILGEKEGKKIVIKEPKERLITGTIDDAILFTVEASPDPDDPFWTDVYTMITGSFAFTTQAEEEAGSKDAVYTESFDEEEVLE